MDSENTERHKNRSEGSKDLSHRFGFTIMAINCLLVETLQSFFMGKKSTKDQSEELSVMFLTTARTFREHFSQATAAQYYADIRCGILHIGETHNLSLVRATGDLVSEHQGSIVINRNKFHSALLSEFKVYLGKLRSKQMSQSRTQARRRMKNKMDFICRIKAESAS